MCSLKVFIVPSVNLIFCLIIFALGVIASKKNKAALFVGIGFGLFAISHALILKGVALELEGLRVMIRIVAYIIVILAMVKLGK